MFIGASRAFLYAGVPSLVVSLWSVDDEATSIIMQGFYRHLAGGRNKNEALREAKLDYLRHASKEKKDPFYWAPFVLIGDSRPLVLPTAHSRALWLAVAIALAALVLAFTARIRHSRLGTKRDGRS